MCAAAAAYDGAYGDAADADDADDVLWLLSLWLTHMCHNKPRNHNKLDRCRLLVVTEAGGGRTTLTKASGLKVKTDL